MATYQSPFTRLRQHLRKQSDFLRDVLQDVTTLTQADLKQNTPGNRLPDEWETSVEVAGRQGKGRVGNARVERDPETWEPVLGYLNFGTHTHYVAPVHAHALHWTNALGEECFSKGHLVGGILGALYRTCKRQH